MDSILILSFASKPEAEAALSIINEMARQLAAGFGYHIDENGSIVGKNAASGADVPTAVTTTWDVPQRSPLDTWYFVSPVIDPRFANWRASLPEGVVMPEDQPLPPEWAENP